jgi:hypothetical protein
MRNCDNYDFHIFSIWFLEKFESQDSGRDSQSRVATLGNTISTTKIFSIQSLGLRVNYRVL